MSDVTDPSHGYICHRCWLQSFKAADVEERWCSYCRMYADEHDGRSPQLWRIDSEKRPVPCTASQVGDWMSTGRETVGFTWLRLPGGGGGVVNTMFMCVDVGGDEAAPMLFETRVMEGNTAAVFDEFTRHYATWTEAAAGHDEAVQRLKAQQQGRVLSPGRLHKKAPPGRSRTGR